MKNTIRIAGLLLLLFMMDACSKVPISGRRQLALIPSSQLLPMSYQQYDQVLKESKPATDQQQVQMVKSVGVKIQQAVQKYMRDNNMADELEGYAWEYNVVQDDQVNAFCMPGGKVVFYTGILPICQDENGVAVVMGHEIAHAIAEHGNERMTQGLATQFGGMALSAALSSKPAATQQLLMAAYGAGSQVGVALPFSRLHETEADKLGLVFMAMAGYDPRGAPEFWKRMAAKGGAKPPEFLSTHPADDTRIRNLNAYMPTALKYYNKN